MGAADELDAVPADDLEELGLALAEAALGLRRVVAVEVRRRVQEHDAGRRGGGGGRGGGQGGGGRGGGGERRVEGAQRGGPRARRVGRGGVPERAGLARCAV